MFVITKTSIKFDSEGHVMNSTQEVFPPTRVCLDGERKRK